MFREERFQLIMKILQDKGQVTAKYLSSELYVSLSTIYKDLKEMEFLGMVTLSHGTVVCNKEAWHHRPYDFRKHLHEDEKAALAREAAKMIFPDAVVFIDSSSTAANIIDCIPPKYNITALTNSLTAASRLKARDIQTYLVGGSLVNGSVAVGGMVAFETIDKFKIDIAFFSSYGINDAGIIVDTSKVETELRRYVLKRSAIGVFLCDKSKFGRNSLYRLLPLEKLDFIITNRADLDGYPAVKKQAIFV